MEFFFRSIDRRWKKQLERGRYRALVFTPFVTPNTADLVIGKAGSRNCALYTRFRPLEFVMGLSSIWTLRKLRQADFPIFAVENLDANVVIVPKEFASVGSQSLTLSGTRGLEVSVAFTEPDRINTIQDRIGPWIAAARPVTEAMIENVEAFVRSHRSVATELATASARLAEEIEGVQPPSVTEATARLQMTIERYLSHESALTALIETALAESVWWDTHVYGPVLSPGFVNRLDVEDDEWILQFGSNTFAVERATRRCLQVLGRFARLSLGGVPWTEGELIERLVLQLQKSVENYSGREYEKYPLYDGVSMKFGAHSVDAEEYSRVILRELGVYSSFFRSGSAART